MIDPEYKKLAEARVSNQTGTTLSEVTAVTLSGVAVCVLSIVVLYHARFEQSVTRRFAEWLALVPLLIILMSSTSETVTFHLGTVLAFVPVFFLCTVLRARSSSSSTSCSAIVTKGKEKNEVVQGGGGERDDAVTVLRGSLMLQTILAILAVDFPIFPSRFMKCEDFGISVMDIGVGAFVFSAAISRSASSANQNQQQQVSFMKELIKTLGTSSLPLFLLGFARVGMVAVTGYQEHVTEYGTHWSFFLTLGFMPVVVLIVQRIASFFFFFSLSSFSEKSSRGGNLPSLEMIDLVAGFSLLILHHLLLSSSKPLGVDLTSYVMSPHRRNIIESNKEGIVSSIGYTALYLIGGSIYSLLLRPSYSSRNNDNNNNNNKDDSNAAIKSMLAGIFFLACSSFFSTSERKVSRRLCNLPYVCVCLGIGFLAYGLCSLILEFALPRSVTRRAAEKVSSRQSILKSSIVGSINSNQLALFLFSNLCTGAVNGSMRTIFASHFTSYTVLLAYLTLVSTVAVLLTTFGLRVKFWK